MPMWMYALYDSCDYTFSLLCALGHILIWFSINHMLNKECTMKILWLSNDFYKCL
jgi:hypothetical protein